MNLNNYKNSNFLIKRNIVLNVLPLGYLILLMSNDLHILRTGNYQSTSKGQYMVTWHIFGIACYCYPNMSGVIIWHCGEGTFHHLLHKILHLKSVLNWSHWILYFISYIKGCSLILSSSSRPTSVFLRSSIN